MSDFGSGHDLTAHEFEPRVGLCADSSETGVPPPLFFLSLFICFERGAGGRGEKRIPSRLWTVSTEPDMGLKLRNREIMT